MGKKISLLVNGVPAELNQDSLLEYKELTIRYPYCQCARLMFLLNLRQVDDQAAYKTQLPLTAIHLPDRTRLKEQVDRMQPVPTAMEQSRQAFPMQKEPLPRRHVESFSPWSQALPRSLNQARNPMPAQAQATTPPPVQPLENPGFTPVVEAPTISQASLSDKPAKRPIKVEEVRDLLNKPKKAPAKAPQSRPQVSADAIIDNFLSGQSEHSITIDESFDYNSFDPDTGNSNREDFSFGGETLAQMYLDNNAPKKAIAVYENLCLKFPEKSSYFANLVRKVKKEYHIK
ncbi:MAG: hypothetical protein NC048_05735 [Bacteroides sp.]|nr:hypothetical protein [Ruminococcus flavefaciens]MCM1554977.1 hypothetical protein [Bacteroides sp.]